jgi:hypothetical protein
MATNKKESENRPKPDNRPQFDGDYLPPLENGKNPFSDSFTKDLIANLLDELRPLTSISLGTAIRLLEAWEVLQEEHEDRTGGNDVPTFDESFGNIQSFPSPKESNENTANEEETLPYFLEYLAQKQAVPFESRLSVRVICEVSQEGEKRILINDNQSKILAYLFGVNIPRSGLGNRYLALVRITDSRGKTILQDRVPIAAAADLSFPNDGMVAVTPDISHLLINPKFDAKFPMRNPHYNLEIIEIESDIGNMNLNKL